MDTSKCTTTHNQPSGYAHFFQPLWVVLANKKQRLDENEQGYKTLAQHKSR